MTTLYEIKDNYRGLLDMDLDAETMADTLEAIEGEFQIKAENICQVMLNIDSDISALDGEVKRLQARKKSLSGKQDSMKEYLRTNMEGIGKKSIKTALFSITRIKGRQTCLVSDEGLIASKYKTTKTTTIIDKASLFADLMEGDEVLGAEITTTKEGLRFK